MVSVFKSVLILAVGLGVAHCDNGAEQKGKSKKQAAVEDDDTDDHEPDNGSIDGDDDESDDDAGDELSAADKAVFQLWCDKAGETEIVKGKMKVFYERFCADGKPTKLFMSSLIKIAFDGKGDPKTKTISDYEHTSTTSEATFGSCIDIPISMQDHFAKVGPKQGNVTSLTKLAVDQDADPASVKITIDEEYKNDGKYHVRGWKIHSESSKTILGFIKLSTDTLIRADQFELKAGKAYMYSQYMLDGKEGIKDYDQFAAGIQLGDQAYLIGQGHVKADNRGFAQEAEKEIPKAAKILIKSNWESASKEK